MSWDQHSVSWTQGVSWIASMCVVGDIYSMSHKCVVSTTYSCTMSWDTGMSWKCVVDNTRFLGESWGL